MIETTSISYRPLTTNDEGCLWEMLYLALFVPPGAPPLPRAVIEQPELSRYVAAWGKETDGGWLAIATSTALPIGAAWLRLLTGEDQGYGYVNDDTPELSIAVKPEYRGRGVGTALMTRLLATAQTRYPAISLSVTANNPARRLYQRLGFTFSAEHEGSWTMVKTLTNSSGN